jgi:nitronate monooxygenase
MSTILADLRVPIVQAPMSGGPSTPELAAAVCDAGALGFVAAGYLTPEALAERLTRTRALTSRPVGVNVFLPGGAPADLAEVERYAQALEPLAARAGVELGRPRFDDDDFSEKIAALCADPVAVVSFTFGCPPAEVVADLQRAGSEVWATVTSAEEGELARAAGVDALVAQGFEAGGHRGLFLAEDGGPGGDFGLLVLLQLLQARVPLPLVASGGIVTGPAIAAVLVAGAAAAQIGTAFMRCPEAATAPAHRAALAEPTRTALTRAFSGRLARGIVNGLMEEHDAHAPHAYPEIHHLTVPLRAHARRVGDADLINLWAGQAHELATDQVPAAELVGSLIAEADAAIAAAAAAAARRR